MRVTMLGVGAAYDPDHSNSTALVEHEGYTVLIDCGYSAPPSIWRARPDPAAIDAILFTHHHVDHAGGYAATIDHWGYAGRRRELVVVTTAEGHHQLCAVCELFMVKPQFPIRRLLPEEAGTLGPFALRTAPTVHYVRNHAIRLEAGGRRFAYSGDGTPTAEARTLYAEADLLFQDCWGGVEDAGRDHGDIALARGIAGPDRVGLYHIRAGHHARVADAVAGDRRMFVVQSGVTIAL